MKCFERLVKSSVPFYLPPWTHSSLLTRSTDDAITMAIHSALKHLEGREFIVYCSAFNTIIPTKLIAKLKDLGFNSHLCNWILDFLTGRPQVVRIASHTPSSLTLSTGAPQGFVLSPLLYSLFTYNCFAKHSSNVIFKS